VKPHSRRDPTRACKGKRRYTEAEAQRRAAILGRQKGIMLEPYLCPHCRTWHIGHPPLKVQLKRAAGDKVLRPRRRG
jgi:hypothetical protein